MLVPGNPDDLIGRTVVGRYHVTERLSQGGMGGIYLATQRPLGRTVALKVLLPAHAADPTSVLRFEKEARAISRLIHPHIVTVFDFGQMESGALFMAMEFLPGDSLRALLDRQGMLSWERTLPILRGVVSGLGEAHRHGIIHRDLKPENVVIVHAGNDPNFPKILDFGVARTVESEPGEASITSEDVIPGTPTYISPERLDGAAGDERTDLYSLGAMWFEMLTGRPPFVGQTSMQVIMQHIKEPPPSLATVAPHIVVPPGVEPLLQALLEKNPGARPSSAQEVLERLDALDSEPWDVVSAREHAVRSTVAPDVLTTPSQTHQTDENISIHFASAVPPPSEAPLAKALEGALAEPILLSKKKDADEPILLSRKKKPSFDVPPPTDPGQQLPAGPTSSELGREPEWGVTPPSGLPAQAAPPAELSQTSETGLPVATPAMSSTPPETGEITEEQARERLQQAGSLEDVAHTLCRFLHRRFDQVAILDLRDALSVLSRLPDVDDEVLKSAFARADALWDIVASGVPYYGPIPRGASWPDLFAAIAPSTSSPHHMPGGVFVACLNRNQNPALVIFATHSRPKLYDDLSPTARLLQDLAAALTALAF